MGSPACSQHINPQLPPGSPNRREGPSHHGSASVPRGLQYSHRHILLEGEPTPCPATTVPQTAAPQPNPAPCGLTCSSSIMRTERSLSSCCRSSIISRRRSSAFSSSQMSGEPIPSSLSSARRRFGEEPLNSYLQGCSVRGQGPALMISPPTRPHLGDATPLAAPEHSSLQGSGSPGTWD